MLKAIAAATAIIIATNTANAAPSPADLFQLETIEPSVVETSKTETNIETAAYCEWVTLYDYWGNWVTYYECY